MLLFKTTRKKVCGCGCKWLGELLPGCCLLSNDHTMAWQCLAKESNCTVAVMIINGLCNSLEIDYEVLASMQGDETLGLFQADKGNERGG